MPYFRRSGFSGRRSFCSFGRRTSRYNLSRRTIRRPLFRRRTIRRRRF